MIASTAMGAQLPAMSSVVPGETTSPAQPATHPNDASVQEAPAGEAAAPHGPTRNTVSQDDKPSEFDRLLETPAANGDATEKSTTPPAAPAATDTERVHTTPKADRSDPSLAEQLLGLLGLLTPVAPAPAATHPGAPPTTTAAPTTPQLPATTGKASALPPAQAAPQSHALATAGVIAMAAAGNDPNPVQAAIDPGQVTAFSAQMAGVAATLMADHVPARGDGAALLVSDATSLAPVVNLATATPAAATTAPVMPAQAPLLQPASAGVGYGDELGASVVWMAEQRVGHAQLQVTPDHLGPIEVRLQLDGARVHAEFYSAQPEVRHALEASLPRLRDLLGQQGLQLGQADVGQRQHNARHAPATSAHGDTDCFPDGSPRPLPTTARRVRGLLDEYA